jgi:uncharacterized protein YndB with AHSA1/START domain
VAEFHIVREYPHRPETLWRALTDPDLVPRWTATGRGGRPEGFVAEVGRRFRYVGKPVPSRRSCCSTPGRPTSRRRRW